MLGDFQTLAGLTVFVLVKVARKGIHQRLTELEAEMETRAPSGGCAAIRDKYRRRLFKTCSQVPSCKRPTKIHDRRGILELQQSGSTAF
jgi:hypothetical protein